MTNMMYFLNWRIPFTICSSAFKQNILCTFTTKCKLHKCHVKKFKKLLLHLRLNVYYKIFLLNSNLQRRMKILFCRKKYVTDHTSVYLLENTKKSVEFIENNLNKKKLLMFYSKFYEVMNHYSNVFFWYKYPGTINMYTQNVEAEIKSGTFFFIQELICVIKIHMPLFLRLQKDERAHVTLDHICSKANTRLQNFLIHIDYWNKVMLSCCQVE